MISVILPTYNSEETLRRSVESVINQKGNFKIELIIINDCSKDNTKNYLKSLENNEKISFIKMHLDTYKFHILISNTQQHMKLTTKVPSMSLTGSAMPSTFNSVI